MPVKLPPRNYAVFSVKEVVLPENGKWKFPLRKALDRELREVKIIKNNTETHEILPTGEDDPQEAAKAETLGIEQKPDASPVKASGIDVRNRRMSIHRTRSRGNPYNPKLHR